MKMSKSPAMSVSNANEVVVEVEVVGWSLKDFPTTSCVTTSGYKEREGCNNVKMCDS